MHDSERLLKKSTLLGVMQTIYVQDTISRWWGG